MPTTIGNAYVQILPSTDGIKENLTNALTGASNSAGQKSGSTFGSSFAKAIGGGAVAIGTAAVATVGAVINTTKAIAEAGDVIDKTSQKMGVSASDYQTMAFAAEHAGFEVSTLQTASRKLADSGFDGTLTDALDAVIAIEDPLQRAAYAEELFGDRVAQQMAALINGGVTMQEYQAQLESLGGMMSDSAVKDAAAFEDSLTNMQTAFEGLKMNIAGQFMPSLTMVMDGLSQLMSGNMDGAKAVADGVSSFLQGIIQALPQIISMAGELIGTLASTLIDMLPEIITVGMQVIIQLAQGIGQALPTLIPAIIDCILLIVDTLLEPDNIVMLVDAAFQLIGGLAMGIIQAIPSLVQKVPELVASLAKALYTLASSLISNGIEFVKNIWQGMQENFADLPEKAKQSIQTNIIEPIKEKWNDIKAVGANLLEGLWNGISDKFSWIIEKVKSLGSSILDAIKGVFGIHSPSREMAKIGDFMVQGLQKGWDDNIDNAMSDINGSLNVSAGKAVGATVVNLTVTDPSPEYMNYLFDKFNVKLAGVV